MQRIVKRLALFGALVLSTLGMAQPASAAVNLDFTIDIGTRARATGTFTCSVAFDANNSCVVDGIVGSITDQLNGGMATAITGMSFFDGADNRITYLANDPLFPFKTDLTRNGLAFTTSSLDNLLGASYKIYRCCTGTFGEPLFRGLDDVTGRPGQAGEPSFISTDIPSVTAVPEPATWAMLIIGFAMIGIRLRRPVQMHRKIPPLPALA